jgi:hypothetical protein
VIAHSRNDWSQSMNVTSRPARLRITSLRWMTMAALLACKAEAVDPLPPTPPAANPLTDRIFAVSPNPRPIPTPAVADYIAGLDTAINGGIRGLAHTYTWSALEPDSARLSVKQARDDMGYTRGRGLTVFLGIQPINTVKRELPADLRTERWSSPRMLARFERLLDAFGADLNTLAYLSIGNEVGSYLAATNEWDDFTVFFRNAVAAVKRRAPNLRVGTTLEWGRTRDADAQRAAPLIAASDVAVFTWYPIGASFRIDRSDPVVAFRDMKTIANGKPVLLQELGIPSGSANGSSEATQAAFFRDAIAAWRARPGAEMPFVNLFVLHDFTPAFCSELSAYYGSADPAFVSYLCTLGLRRTDGTAKPAWSAVVAAVR